MLQPQKSAAEKPTAYGLLEYPVAQNQAEYIISASQETALSYKTIRFHEKSKTEES